MGIHVGATGWTGRAGWRAGAVAAQAAGLVRAIDEVDYARAAQMMCAADGLVLIQAPSAGGIQAVAGKTYDYLRSGRPNFIVAPEGDNLALVRRHASTFESSGDSVDAMADALERLYRRWQQGEFGKAGAPDPAFTERYERRALTRELAGHFDRLGALGENLVRLVLQEDLAQRRHGSCSHTGVFVFEQPLEQRHDRLTVPGQRRHGRPRRRCAARAPGPRGSVYVAPAAGRPRAAPCC